MSEGIYLTKKAAEKVRGFAESAGFESAWYLFLGVKGGGCSGLEYVMDIREEEYNAISDTDEVFESEDIRIVCDLKSYIVGNLGGTKIDYMEEMLQQGFVFDNPNASHVCGCKKSFHV